MIWCNVQGLPEDTRRMRIDESFFWEEESTSYYYNDKMYDMFYVIQNLTIHALSKAFSDQTEILNVGTIIKQLGSRFPSK